jgi:K+-sensing histidine kinase KdpD
MTPSLTFPQAGNGEGIFALLLLFRVQYDAQKAERLGGSQEPWGERMWITKGTVPVAASLGFVCAVTAVLWYLKLATAGPEHPLFFYLVPLSLVTFLFGRVPALLGVLTAAVCADFFLYDPLYTFDMPSRGEFGDLAWFGVLAVIVVKCAGELFRPATKVPATKSRFGAR